MYKNIHGTAKGREFLQMGDDGTGLYTLVEFFVRRRGSTVSDYLEYLGAELGVAGPDEVDNVFSDLMDAQRMGLLEVV